MARFSKIINSFTGGELSPRYHGRTDLGDLYQNGAHKLENFVPKASGGVSKRTGTTFVSDVTSSNTFSRLFSFRSSTGINRIFGMPARSETVGAISGPAKPDVDAIVFDGGYVESGVTVSAPAYRSVTGGLYEDIYNDTTDPSSSNIEEGFLAVSTEFFVGSGESSQEAQYAQVGDVLVICHPNNPPIYLKAESNTSFTEYSFRDFAAVPSTFVDSDGSTAISTNFSIQWMLGTPFRDQVIDKTAQPVMSVSSVTLGASVTVTITNASVWGGFTSGHIGAVFTSTISSETGAVVITSITSSTVATGRVLRTFGGTSTTSSWRESSWSNARGWPRSVTYFQGRLFFGGNASEPNKIWASQAFDIGQFTPHSFYEQSTGTNPSAVATDPFQASLISTQMQWMASNDNNIFVGTLDREYIVELSVSTSSTTLESFPQTNYGSSYVQAFPVNNTIVFVGADGRTVREMAFNFNDDNFVADDLSKFADHLVDEVAVSKLNISGLPTEIVNIQVQRYPENRVFCLTDEGGFYSLTRDRQLGVAAWSRYKFNASDDSDSNASNAVSSFCLRQEDIYIKISRTINSSSKSYLEYFSAKDIRHPIMFSQQKGVFLGVYLDMAKQAVTASSSVTGLTHLEGETVRCLGSNDGKIKDYGTFTVSSSAITLPESADYTIVGVEFDATIITLPLEAGSVLGNAQGVLKRIEEIVVRFYKSIGCSVAPGAYALEDFSRTSDNAHIASIYTVQATRDFEDFDFIPTNIPLQNQLPLFTGDKSKRLDSSYDERGQIILKSSSPYPCTIGSIVLKGVTYEPG